MQETRYLAITLFGKKIPLPSEEETLATISGYELASQSQASERDLIVVDEDDDKDSNSVSNPKTPCIYQENNNDNNNNKEGASKKILPCPRCNSMDTKFCYFNNYNVKQPRHLCRSCQRYWTAGGSMRTVPVGSGRRKSKSSGRPLPSNIVSNFIQQQPQQQHQNMGEDCSSSSAAASPNFQFLSYNWWLPPLPPVMVGKRRQRAEGGVLVPKTLRIDDPSQVAKSSIWTTLGIDKDGVEMMFQGFQSKNRTCDYNDGENHKSNSEYTKATTNLLMANPAALSRSMNFHETS